MVNKSTYFDLFVGESGELLAALNRDAVEFERNPADPALIDSIFRGVHTLKGMAGIMEYRHLASFLHEFESMLDGLRKKTLLLTEDVASLLFQSIDAVSNSVAAIGRGKEDAPLDEAILEKISALRPKEGSEPANVAAMPAAPEVEGRAHKATEFSTSSAKGDAYSGRERRTNLRLEDEDREKIFSEVARGLHPYEVIVRLADDCAMPRARAAVVVGSLKESGEVIREQQLDRQMTGRSFGQYFGFFFLSGLSGEELKAMIESVVDVQEAMVKTMDLEFLPRTSRAQKPSAPAAPASTEVLGSTRVELSKLARLMDVTGELLLARLRIEDLASGPDRKGFAESIGRLARLMSELQHEVLKLQLIPIDYLFGAYPRLVRDIAAKQGKKVKLVLTGGEIGLDKRALDALNDPLMHLIRNAVNHGIESPEERKKAGKSEEGVIRIEARRERDSVIVLLSDDGKGISPSIAGEERPPDGSPELFSQLLDVICRAGFSTSAGADAIAGRGVGMEVARSGVENIGGKLSLASSPGAGTSFTLSVPLTLSIIQALLFQIGKIPYAIPLTQVREIVNLTDGDIHHIDCFRVFKFRGEIVPLIEFPFDPELLSAAHPALNLLEGGTSGEAATALIVEARSRLVGLRVDSLKGRQETIVKPMPTLLRGTPGLSGATILGDGRVAFVLDLASAL